MSADNWAICPRCARRERARLADLQQQVKDGYGVLPLEEFDALRAEADAGVDVEKCRTFREDYEIYGAEEGEVYVNYRGNCATCALHLDFTHSVPISDAFELGSKG